MLKRISALYEPARDFVVWAFLLCFFATIAVWMIVGKEGRYESPAIWVGVAFIVSQMVGILFLLARLTWKVLLETDKEKQKPELPFFVGVPLGLFFGQAILLGLFNVFVVSSTTGPPNMDVLLIILDCAFKGSFFDFLESFELHVGKFDPPPEVKLYYNSLIFMFRFTWSAWSGVCLYLVIQMAMAFKKRWDSGPSDAAIAAAEAEGTKSNAPQVDPRVKK